MHEIIDHILEVEGEEYTNHADDSGGPTKWGIIENVARKSDYEGDMRDLPRDVAFSIYRLQYWQAICGDEMQNLSSSIVKEVADTGVNMGVSRSSKFLQRALNVLNRKGELYTDLKVDGNIGPATIEALRLYLNHRSELVMLQALNALQGAFYIELAERREKDESFIYGWFKKRIEI